jgi:hypothetical protein
MALALAVMFLGAKSESEFWVFAGLLAVFCGLIITLVSSTELSHIKNRVIDVAYEQQRDGGSKVKVRCASCNNLNDEASKFCGHCGHVL